MRIGAPTSFYCVIPLTTTGTDSSTAQGHPMFAWVRMRTLPPFQDPGQIIARHWVSQASFSPPHPLSSIVCLCSTAFRQSILRVRLGYRSNFKHQELSESKCLEDLDNKCSYIFSRCAPKCPMRDAAMLLFTPAATRS